ncbi:MAG TPA: 4-hydroxythreonine-4-phosphate dehydrogenase PdxA [Legionella sp.]|nr:4-hydroxythreonine-4-phosphate dehydrogenase PdxA [Legionella sp.]
MKPLLVSSGEPAGIGPDLCLALAGHNVPLVVLGDKQVLEQRARQLNWSIAFDEYHPGTLPVPTPHHLTVLSIPCAAPVVAGKLDSSNAPYVLAMLKRAASGCLHGEFAALITAPVHKAIINQAGIDFTGHTEFFAQHCQTETVVMMLVCNAMRVALVTTHLPLRAVADAITQPLLTDVITILDKGLRDDFDIACPKIHVAGLNPHAGEGGFLGREELDTIIPALSALKNKGIQLSGPFPADTMFTPHQAKQCDAFVAMYHDQGLPVLKYAGFGTAVNVTLGLPIIRTSVDHGTALELAGTGLAASRSLVAAVDLAARMVKARS